MATRLEKYSYNQFKTALDRTYNSALLNLEIDGLASVNWIKNDFILESYHRVWGNVSLYTAQKQQRAILGVSKIMTDPYKANVANYVNAKCYGRVQEVWAYSKTLYTQAVNDALQTATNEGLGVEATQRRIRQLVNGKLKGDINIWRARRIARTEMVSSGNYGSWQAMEDSVVNYGANILKVWVTSFKDSRPEHELANGQERETSKPFNVGGEALMYPGDPVGSSWNVINCQCATHSRTPDVNLNFIRY